MALCVCRLTLDNMYWKRMYIKAHCDRLWGIELENQLTALEGRLERCGLYR